MPYAEVNQGNEFREIMNDFTHPLEILRELTQNSMDAECANIHLEVTQTNSGRGDRINIFFEDDGNGIQLDNISNFFNLGDSTKRNHPGNVGAKGHGVKIIYNSEKIILYTWINSKKYKVEMNEPYYKIFNGEGLFYSDIEEVTNIENKTNGVKVEVYGYLANSANEFFDYFSHPSIKDYLLWFSTFGSLKNLFNINYQGPLLHLKTVDSHEPTTQNEYEFTINDAGYEVINHGHVFYPNEIYLKNDLKRIASLYNERRWEDYFCKKLYHETVQLELNYNMEVIIWAEGDKLKRLYNKLIRRSGANNRQFHYKVSERYGFWACKNYVPIQRIDDWIIGKGQYTKFHAFVNFEGFSLTANRSSINNTNQRLLQIVKERLNSIYSSVIANNHYKAWNERQLEAENERSAEEENREFARRVRKLRSQRRINLGGIVYYEPKTEGEVALLLIGMINHFRNDPILNFNILDYSTHKGVDFLTRSQLDLEIENDNTIRYIELKLNLEKNSFNHSFRRIDTIICFDTRGLINNEVIRDIEGNRLMVRIRDNNYILTDSEGDVGHSINVIILERFLRDRNFTFQ